MSTARKRERQLSSTNAGDGRKYHLSNGVPFGTTDFTTIHVTGRESNSDYLSSKPYPDHAWNLSKRTCRPTRFSGQLKFSGSLTQILQNWTADRWANFAYGPGPSTFNMDQLETAMFKSLNPNKPIVDMPVFLFELLQFPRMLKDLGDVLLKKKKPGMVPGGYLAYEMGWKPLVSDLMALGTLVETMKKEAEFHKSLARGRKVTRNVLNSTLHDAFAGTLSLQSAQYTLLGRSIKRELRGWFSARVKLKDEFPFDPRSQGHDSLVRALGLRVSPATLWEAIPWSWLIDYFANVGDILEANRGSFPYQVSNVCLMLREIATENLYVIFNPQGLDISPGSWMGVYKKRAVRPSPRLKIVLKPALNGRQKAILGSLVLAKVLKGPLGGVR